MKFMEESNYQKLIKKLAFYLDCVGKCKYKYWQTTCLCACDMNSIGDTAKNRIAFISHERKQVRVLACI